MNSVLRKLNKKASRQTRKLKLHIGAGNGARTRHIQLGRLTLYQLSYSRIGKNYFTIPAGSRQEDISVNYLQIDFL